MQTQATRISLQSAWRMVGMTSCLLSCFLLAQQRSSWAQHRGRTLPPRQVTALFDLVSSRARTQQQAYWQQCLRSHEKPAYVYHVVAIAPYSRQYRIADWKLVSSPVRKETEGGVSGAWAQVVEKGLDARGAWSDQGGYALYHYGQGHWQRMASHEGLGYEPAALRKAHVPAPIRSRLKLSLREE